MTSINAMKFNQHMGILISDEQRSWNPEIMLINSCEKIKKLTDEEMFENYQLTAFYGHTGTSSLGDEIFETLRRKILKKYEDEVKNSRTKPEKFMTIKEIADLGFQTMIELKRRHIDEQIKGYYGFTANEFIKGSYKKDDKEIEIKEKEIIDKIPKYLTWEGRLEEVTGVFLNAAVVAGYEPNEGFRIFLLSMIDPVCEPVQEIFIAEGSGLLVADPLFTKFANSKTIPERRGNIDPVEGTLKMIEGLVMAYETCVGVGGYLKIILIDAKNKDKNKRVKEVADRRAKLAEEIVSAYVDRLIPKAIAYDLIKELLFEDKSFVEVNEKLFNSVQDKELLDKYLRKYHGLKI